MASSRPRSSQAATSSQLGAPLTLPVSLPNENAAEEQPHLPHLNINDLQMIAADIKDTLAAAISELRLDLRTLSDRVTATEQTAEQQDLQLRKTTRHVDTHTLQMRDMQTYRRPR